MKAFLVICMLVAMWFAAMVPRSAHAAEGSVVDDDGAQCPDAGFTSIQAAVDDANAYDVIKVCAGRYAEQVTVDKPLEIEGDGAPLDLQATCFATTLPALPASEYVIVEPTASPAFLLDADDIDLAGFVVSNPSTTGTFTGVVTSDDHSGYRVHGNLFVGNTLAVVFGSGARPESREASRVDHNCIRNARWAVADGSLSAPSTLINARVDHNLTFGVRDRTYELVHGAQDVVFDHNVSSLDNNVFLLSGSIRTRVVENTIDRGVLGMEIGRFEANRHLEVSVNTFLGDAGAVAPRASIAITFGFVPGSSGERNSEVTVAGNTITGYNTGIAIGGPPGTVTGSLEDSNIVGNTITGSRQNAVRLRALNTGITFSANTLNGNAWHGIHAICGLIPGTTTEACPTGNTFIGNELLGNGIYDARDDTGIAPDGTLRPLQNMWIDNRCVKDLPAGLLCVVP
jgi:hypothetical protein